MSINLQFCLNCTFLNFSLSFVFPFSGAYLKLEGIKRIAEGRLRCFGMFDVKRDSSKISREKDSGGFWRRRPAVTSAIMISSSSSCIGIVEIKLRAGGEDFHSRRDSTEICWIVKNLEPLAGTEGISCMERFWDLGWQRDQWALLCHSQLTFLPT